MVGDHKEIEGTRQPDALPARGIDFFALGDRLQRVEDNMIAYEGPIAIGNACMIDIGSMRPDTAVVLLTLRGGEAEFF